MDGSDMKGIEFLTVELVGNAYHLDGETECPTVQACLDTFTDPHHRWQQQFYTLRRELLDLCTCILLEIATNLHFWRHILQPRAHDFEITS